MAAASSSSNSGYMTARSTFEPMAGEIARTEQEGDIAAMGQDAEKESGTMKRVKGYLNVAAPTSLYLLEALNIQRLSKTGQR